MQVQAHAPEQIMSVYRSCLDWHMQPTLLRTDAARDDGESLRSSGHLMVFVQLVGRGVVRVVLRLPPVDAEAL
jgi:hypothetical protein